MSKEIWKWCLHCNRCYLEGEFRVNDDPFMNLFYSVASKTTKTPLDRPKACPYPGCDGTIVCDSWEWENVRQGTNWPVTPKRGKVYDIYKKKTPNNR